MAFCFPALRLRLQRLDQLLKEHGDPFPELIDCGYPQRSHGNFGFPTCNYIVANVHQELMHVAHTSSAANHRYRDVRGLRG